MGIWFECVELGGELVLCILDLCEVVVDFVYGFVDFVVFCVDFVFGGFVFVIV